MTTPEGRHETTDGSITAPCVCGEWHDLSFFLDAATRALPALLAVAEAAETANGALNMLFSDGPIIDTIAAMGDGWNSRPDRTLYDALRRASLALRAALAALPTDR